MAFLCKGRMRKKKKKGSSGRDMRGLFQGRITGSDSIDTLAIVGRCKEEGLSPASEMIVLHSFEPRIDDEVQVKQGDRINAVYREHDWLYVITKDGREGFIPFKYAAVSKKQHITQDASTPKLFSKQSLGQYLVLFPFEAKDENDLSVDRGDRVTLVNNDDLDWVYVSKVDGNEGFIPRTFVSPYIENTALPTIANRGRSLGDHSMDNTALYVEPMDRAKTQLLVLYDYKAQAPDDLTIHRGELLYANLQDQEHSDWIRVFHPKHNSYGYIPRTYAQPPAALTNEAQRPADL